MQIWNYLWPLCLREGKISEKSRVSCSVENTPSSQIGSRSGLGPIEMDHRSKKLLSEGEGRGLGWIPHKLCPSFAKRPREKFSGGSTDKIFVTHPLPFRKKNASLKPRLTFTRRELRHRNRGASFRERSFPLLMWFFYGLTLVCVMTPKEKTQFQLPPKTCAILTVHFLPTRTYIDP